MRACVRWLAVLWFSIVTLAHAQEIVTLSTGSARRRATSRYAAEESEGGWGFVSRDLGLIHLRKEGDQIKFDTGIFSSGREPNSSSGAWP